MHKLNVLVALILILIFFFTLHKLSLLNFLFPVSFKYNRKWFCWDMKSKTKIFSSLPVRIYFSTGRCFILRNAIVRVLNVHWLNMGGCGIHI